MRGSEGHRRIGWLTAGVAVMLVVVAFVILGVWGDQAAGFVLTMVSVVAAIAALGLALAMYLGPDGRDEEERDEDKPPGVVPPEPDGGADEPSGPRRWPRRPIIVVAVILLAVLAVGASIMVPRLVANRPPCKAPAELRVAVPDAVRNTVQDLAEKFEEETTDDGCRTARLSVFSPSTAGEAADALAAGWRFDSPYILNLGPTPDVWIVESSLLIDIARNTTPDTPSGQGPPKLGLPRSVASTPLVLAMPKVLASRLDGEGRLTSWMDGGRVSLSKVIEDVTRHPSDKLRIGYASPGTYAEGMLSTVALYQAQTGSDDLDGDVLDKQSAPLRDLEKEAVEPIADEPEKLLCDLWKDDRGESGGRAAMVLVAGNVVDRYNDDVAAVCSERTSEHSLDWYQVDTALPVFDYPVVVVEDDDRSEKRKKAATAFADFLLRDDNARFIREKTGLGEPIELPKPEDDRVEAADVRDKWSILRRRTDVLVAVDVSGSMDREMPDGSARRLDVVKSEINPVIDFPNEEDLIGLWKFATNLDDGVDYKVLVELGPASDKQRVAVKKELEDLSEPDGNTGLLDTIRAGVEKLATGGPETIKAMIVVTDGVHDDPGISISAEDLNGILLERHVDVTVLALGDENCGDETMEKLRETVRCRPFTDSRSLRRVLDEVATSLWGIGAKERHE